jgi:hypothetical protein
MVRADSNANESAEQMKTSAAATKVELSSPVTKRNTNGAVIDQDIPSIVSAPATTIQLQDSVDFMLTTEPWAHVLWNGRQLGTTPLESALRLPAGEHAIILRNPAFPPIELPVKLNQSAQMNVKLADYVAQLIFTVEPWGEIAIDGEPVGATPLKNPLYVSPGRHTIRISHPALTAISREMDTAAGQVMNAKANLNHGTFQLNGGNGP